MAEEQVKMEREQGFLPEQESQETFEVAAEQDHAEEQEVAEETEPVADNVVQLDAYRPQQDAVAPVPDHRDPVLKEIEHVMSEGLREVYEQLPANKKQTFRMRGEEAARKIRDMMKSGKPRTYKTVKLLDEWLQLIPNVNKYYLRQETKRKADKLREIRVDENDIGQAAA